MSNKKWVSPVPAGIGRGARVFRPGRDIVVVTDYILERASLGLGVRAYRWPDGTVAVVTRDGREDAMLESASPRALMGTYARGCTFADVRGDLQYEGVAA